MNIWVLVLILIAVGAIGTSPHWPYSQGWGYYPAGGLGTVAIIILILLALRVI